MSDAKLLYNPQSDAADAARLFTRIGMLALAVGVPVAAGLPGNAMAILFAFGVILVAVAQVIDPAPGVRRRYQDLQFSALAFAFLALLAWAALSLVWTPFPSAGLRRIGIVLIIGAPAFITIFGARPHVKASDLYLFPVGVIAAVVATLGLAIAGLNGAPVSDVASANLATAVVMLVFPAMAGLAARGRNGWARTLVILALVYTRIAGPPASTAALLVGFAAFSFALSDAPRTARDLGRLAAGLVLLAPLAPLLAPGIVRMIAHVDIATLPQPGPALGAMADVIHADPLRLLTGHGIEAAVRAAKGGVLPGAAPRGLVAQIWYDLGLVGAAILAFGLWRAFAAIDDAAPRMQPYLMATLACALSLALTSAGWGEESWLLLLATGAISADCALRGQYRTSAPFANAQAHF